MKTSPLRSMDELERRGLRDRVHDRILAALLEGQLEPRSRLSIDTIARQLGVSPTPVREAMVQLERTGLVTREALKGYRVAPPLTSQELEELFEARMMIELEVTRLAVRNMDLLLPRVREAHAVHQAYAEQVMGLMSRGESDVRLTQDYFAADAAFHHAIVESTSNRYLRAMYEDLGALTHRMRQAVIRGTNDVQEAHAEHTKILTAMESSDPEAAVDAMRRHIEGVRARSMRDEATV